MLLHLAPLRLGSIELRPVPELARTEVLVAAYLQLLPAGPYTTKGHIHMWMLGVVMQGGNPLQPRAEVLFHSNHSVPRQPFKMQAVPDSGDKINFQTS